MAARAACTQTTSEPSRVSAVVEAQANIALFLGLADQDAAFLDAIFHQEGAAGWTVLARSSLGAAFAALREARVSIVICDADTLPEGWRDIVECFSLLPDPPLLIVTSRLADERLWAEALNLGAWDVLAKPFDAAEVIRTVDVALQHWRNRRDRARKMSREPGL